MNFWDKVEGTQEFSSLKLYHYVCSDGAPPFFCAHSFNHHFMSGQCQLSQKGMLSKITQGAAHVFDRFSSLKPHPVDLDNSQHNAGHWKLLKSE